jgi:RNA polymerase sigma factor (sigma-70 family)
MSDADRKLIIACRRGDERAWETLVARYDRLVFSIARRHGLSIDDAADVTQTVFVILLQSIDRLSDDVNLGGWLTTVTRRHSWRTLARRGRELPGEKEDVAESSVLLGRQSSDPIDRWETLQAVHKALNRLSERCRQLLLALYFDPAKPSYAEVSARLNMPVGSIGPTRARCLAKLKALLEEEG